MAACARLAQRNSSSAVADSGHSSLDDPIVAVHNDELDEVRAHASREHALGHGIDGCEGLFGSGVFTLHGRFN